MNLTDLIKRVRSDTRDFSNSIFREVDIKDYINESIERFKQVIPQFRTMDVLNLGADVPQFIPEQYHHLLAKYSASRCFAQDERHYQATTLMNEFETKIEELKEKIESGEIVIVDSEDEPIMVDMVEDYVVDNYFLSHNGLVDEDDGVEGVLS